MPLDFPSTPTIGDQYTGGNRTWEWNGTSWIQVVATANISDNAVTSAKIASGAVGSTEIATDAILSTHVSDSAITTDHLASNAVTTAKIADGAITSAKIADGTITNADIASNANINISKLSGNGIAQMLVNADSGLPQYRTITGDWSMSSLGVATISNGAVTQAKMASGLSAVTVCTSSNKPASPFDGQVIYMTDADQNAVWDGSSWVGLDPSRDRNVVINGAMQVTQRGTSTASITTNGYYTADRFAAILTTCGTWTQSVEADAPTGSGFRNSLKMLCTTADASPTGLDQVRIDQYLEGQNLQQFAKGTASAKQFILSFWAKANVTGTYIVTLIDADNTRICSGSYSISASATWEKKTITFPADTTGAFDNDNNASLRIVWWLAAGTDYTSGTLQTTWAANTNANRAVGQTNLASATNNYWQITGVQLEAGAVATPFEFEDYGATLAKCQRYYIKSFAQSVSPAQNSGETSVRFTAVGGGFGTFIHFPFKTEMRAAPNITGYNPSNTNGLARNTSTGGDIQYVATSAVTTYGFNALFYGANHDSTTQYQCAWNWVAEAEL